MSRTHRLALLLVVATAAIYAPLGRFDFVHYDDPEFVFGQPKHRQGVSVETLRWALTDTSGNYWHPVTSIAHVLAFASVGEDPGRQHLVNVAIFLATVAALFYVLNAVLRAPVVAFLATAMWAWHPLRVETVAWLTERGGVLSGFFTVVTIAAYVRYARRPVVWRYLLVATCFALALLSKPIVPLLPIGLLLIDFWPLDRMRNSWERQRWRGIARLAIEKLPLLALAAGVSFVTWRLASVVIRSDAPPPSPAIDELLAIPASYAWFVVKTVLPIDLAVQYPWSGAWGRSGGAIAAVVLIGVTWWALRRRCAPLIAGWFWFLLMLLPMLLGARLRSSWVADRYAYMPHLLLIAGIVAVLATRRLPRWSISIVCVVFALVSALQVQQWRDSETLFSHALDVTRRNEVMHNNLGVALAAQGRHAEAIEQYRRAIDIQPRYADARNNLGAALAAQGRHAEAIEQYRAAIDIQPRHADAHIGLGVALELAGDLAGAERELRTALAIAPNKHLAHFNLGHVFAAQGRLQESAEQYAQALRLKPDHLESHVNLGAVLERLGDRAGAASHYEAALRIDPHDPDARANLEALRAGRSSPK